MSVPSPIDIDILIELDGQGQIFHVLVFSENFEWQLTIIFLKCPYYDSIGVSCLHNIP